MGGLRSTHTSILHTASSTWTAALAAGLSYGSLILTSFRGFKQFGIIGLIGMTLCWISAYTVLPALLTLLHGVHPLRFRKARVERRFGLMRLIAAAISRWPRSIATASIAATVLSLMMLPRAGSWLLET